MIVQKTFSLTLDDKNLPEPLWKDDVERWYQIDGPAYGLCEMFWQNKSDLETKPQAVLLNSPEASYKTDLAFCKTLSPSKFVHTLPNVRSSSLFQLMKWSGPLYSFVRPSTEILEEAKNFLKAGIYDRVWLIDVVETPQLQVHWHVLENKNA
jgi:hypothetical protein